MEKNLLNATDTRVFAEKDFSLEVVKWSNTKPGIAWIFMGAR